MKRIALIVVSASIFAACNNNDPLLKGSRTEIDSVRIVKESIKNIRDSLKLDSFERAEQNRTMADEQTANAAFYRPATQTQYVRTTNYESRPAVYASEPAVQTRRAKKGWSSAAKGTAIGAGVGAVTGVLVDKKNGRGAIIGGLLGAGTGYVIGRSHDRKTGRVQ
jgi:hypothetical protein